MKCNKLIQIRKYSKSQHLGIGKRPFFFFGKLIIGGMEAWRVGIKMLVKKFRKNNNRGVGGGAGGGQIIGTREYSLWLKSAEMS